MSDEQVDYTHQLCWVNNTYYYPGVSDADLFPESNKQTLLYYQYILFILFGQALLFFLPTMIWNILAKDSIGYIQKILDQCQKAHQPEHIAKILERAEKRRNRAVNLRSAKDAIDESTALEPLIVEDELAEKFTNDFKSVVSLQNEIEAENENELYEKKEASGLYAEQKPDPFPPIKESGKLKEGIIKRFSNFGKPRVLNFMKPLKGVRHFAFHYIFLKVLNLLNVVLQMFLLHFIFGNRFFFYGIDFFTSLLHNKNPFFLTSQFPIITFCDFYVYQNLRKIYYNAAQCVLPINVLIEKFFLIIWFWYYLLIILTVINIFVWLFEIAPGRKVEFLIKYLNIRMHMERSRRQTGGALKQASVRKHDELIDREHVKEFYWEYCGNDGVIMLHLIKSVAGGLIFMDLLSLLWVDYNKNGKIKKTN